MRRELGVLAFISVLAIAIRAPFLFPAVIDWDESTFIIIGQSALDGFLPYEIVGFEAGSRVLVVQRGN